MQITGTSNESISIEFLTTRPVDRLLREDIFVAVTVRYHAFFGEIQLWILQAQWGVFVESLGELERTRAGVARLSSMSPGELDFTFRMANRRSALVFEGKIGKSGLHPATLQFGPIDLDSSMLSHYLTEFKAL